MCARGLALRTPIITSFKSLKSSLVYANFFRTMFVWTMQVPNLNTLLSYRYSGVNELHNLYSLNYFTHVCNGISVLAELVKFAMVKVDNFCKYKLIIVSFKLFDGKHARIVGLNWEQQTKKSIWMFNDIFIVMSKEVAYWLYRSKLKFVFR